MTVTQRKPPPPPPDEFQAVNEPGVEYQCDSCSRDLTHTIRIKCADPACATDEGVDICPTCFCAGKEFGTHKRSHSYRVIEFNSYPIFTDDWGADEELLLLKGIASQGLGNWKKVADHVGTRTKEEVEQHYNSVYVDSITWPLPDMNRVFDIDPAEFQERKRRRITEMNSAPLPVPKPAPVSTPAIHELQGFLPGRLEFEHELDNEAEDLVKDLEFGTCLQFGGDQIIEDENDLEVCARKKWEEEKRTGIPAAPPVPPPPPIIPKPLIKGKGVFSGKVLLNGLPNGSSMNGILPLPVANGHSQPDLKPKEEDGANAADEETAVDEVVQPPPIETEDSLAFKFTLVEMYSQRIEKRLEGKALMFDRGLTEFKKMQAADKDKKRPKEEKDILHRLRPFARLQTAEDYEAFAADMLYEALLRKRIQELQQYRRLGLVNAADIDKYELDLLKRTQAKAASREHFSSERLQYRTGGRQSSGPDPRRGSHVSLGEAEDRKSHDREGTPRVPGSASTPAQPVQSIRRGPLNLANSPSLHLLTHDEQVLCSSLRILPKPYLVIKETLVREYARRGGKLRRRECRDLVKIDVNKTSRVWDYLVSSGCFKIAQDPVVPATAPVAVESSSGAPSINGSVMPSPRPAALAPPSFPSTQNGVLSGPSFSRQST
ncbi:hypothetical protein C8J56DRAFT_916247 [Mycena floridula]|nr:hypothetical protein C8J56DRAFT_916247 [Mycena floridula]